ncbi:dehydrase and lipid transport-domain-containing protein [Crepidotus variabilis]|uniref:Dehydrase and lipid transport-domain-containing protein n=1 Tax=Crepidotus variabilis TaxID=179855 RepID=A0A9P6ERR2_9AGAR|nr:dehydrase and lipid transport-domain-containing protein [Crepidotus variabilis]
MLLSSTTFRSLPTLSTCCRRNLFSLPNLSSFSPFESKSKTYHEERVLPYTEKELYAVVADVASYPKFIPFCTGSRIDASALTRAMKSKTVTEAELTVGFMSFQESYISTVTCVPFKSVQAVASSSTPLFTNLSTIWKFQSNSSTRLLSKLSDTPDDPPGPTLVSYDLTYEFANPLHAAASATFFSQVAGMMIKAFEDRCRTVYGPQK